jgi:YidC/Oxa1 family membrane protein insertase
MFESIINFMADMFNYFYVFMRDSMGISHIGLAYVLAIFAFTVVIRVLILPFNIKAAKSTQGMQKIQPEVKKLQEKYKDDPQKLNAETMKLYKEKNVSVTGGCLPSLLPLPILMALYWVFMGIKGIDGSSFLWIKDLAAPDKLFILPVLAALSTYVPSYLMAKATPSQPGGMNMGTMNLMMAGMMGFMSLNFKSILVLYWIIGNLIQGIQTYFLNYKPAMEEINSRKEKEVQAGEEKFVMTVEEPKNLASKKRKKNK